MDFIPFTPVRPPRRGCALAWWLGFSFTFLAVTAAADRPRWQPVADGVWSARIAGWELRVCAAQARLCALLPPGSDRNVLAADGHRVWLGPQTSWEAFWPPQADWEQSAAESVAASPDGLALTLVHPQTNPAYPRLMRTYTLFDDRLQLSVAWICDGTPHQALQILQLQPDVVAEVVAVPTEEVPHGFGRMPMGDRPDVGLDEPMPTDVAEPLAGEHRWRLRVAGRAEKLGFAPQAVPAVLPDGRRLVYSPGHYTGVAVAAPEAGLFSQIYLGSTAGPLLEVEQFSPLLRGEQPGAFVRHLTWLHLPPVE
jgi:hypothetical protein